MSWGQLNPHLDKDGVEGHLRGFLCHQATKQLQSHVHLTTHATANMGHQGAHHLLIENNRNNHTPEHSHREQELKTLDNGNEHK